MLAQFEESDFSNFGSLKSTETRELAKSLREQRDFSNFGSLKSTETLYDRQRQARRRSFQQFRLVEEH